MGNKNSDVDLKENNCKGNNKKDDSTENELKSSKKRPKGFTLIELLAVIIILGILLVIAIPSVTTYIANSRKTGYIDTAKQMISGARSLINSGKLDVFDQDATYYVPITCVGSEIEAKTPYGDFDKAYIVVTYTGSGYDYYWTSTDTAQMGIKDLVAYENLSVDNLESGVAAEDIKDNTSVGKRKIVKIFNDDCTSVEEKIAFVPERAREGTLVEITSRNNVFGRVDLNKAIFEKIIVTTSIDIPLTAIDSWDASKQKNGSIVAWYVDSDNNGLYELYIGQKDGVIAGTSIEYAFADYSNVSYIDLTDFDTSNVVNMTGLFSNSGTNVSSFQIIGLKYFDTTNVTNMSLMFNSTGSSATTWSIGDLSNWNVSNVNSMSNMFASSGSSATNWSIGNIGRWDVSKVRSFYFMFSGAAYNASRFDLGNLNNWNVSSATAMGSMFHNAGYKAKYWNIGDLSNWDTSNVTSMSFIFAAAGHDATTWNSIGSFKIYSAAIDHMCYESKNIKANFDFYATPSFNRVNTLFKAAATGNGSYIIINYTSDVTNVDDIVNSRTGNGNIRKGSLIE